MSKYKMDGTPIRQPEKVQTTQLTHEMIQEVVKWVRVGVHPATAFANQGVRRGQFYNWASQGVMRPKSIYGEMVDEIRRAAMQLDADVSATILSMAKGRAAEYAKDRNGDIVRDHEGKPIRIRDEIKPNTNLLMYLDQRTKSLLNTLERELADQVDTIEVIPNEEEVKELARLVLLNDPDAD